MPPARHPRRPRPPPGSGRAHRRRRRRSAAPRPRRGSAASISRSKPSLVPSASIEVSRISPAPDASASSAHCTASIPVPRRPPWVVTSKPDGQLRPSRRPTRRASIAITTHCEPNRLAASDRNSGRATAAELIDTLSAPARSSASMSSVRPDAAADRQRNEHLFRGAADHLVGAAPVVAGRGDVQEGQLVGALFVVPAGQLDRVAGIDEINEVDALDHPTLGHIEARDDADGDGHADSLRTRGATLDPDVLPPPSPDPERPDLVRRLSRDPTIDPPPGSPDEPADEFCRLACLVYSEVDSPERWAGAANLAADPEVVDASIAAAACAADPEAHGRAPGRPIPSGRPRGRAAPVAAADVSGVLPGTPRRRAGRAVRAQRAAPARRRRRAECRLPVAGLDPAVHGADRRLRRGRTRRRAPAPAPALAMPWHACCSPPAPIPMMDRPCTTGCLGRTTVTSRLLFEFGLGRVTGGPWADLLGDLPNPSRRCSPVSWAGRSTAGSAIGSNC